MIIYLKSGQTIDMGDVNKIMDDSNNVFKPLKYVKGVEDAIIDIPYNGTESKSYIYFFNTNNEILEIKESELIGIREDVK